MSKVGIEAMNLFGGSASLDVAALARHRGLDTERFANLLMHEKGVALPCEDPVTFAVNAAYPLLERMSPEQRDSIELLITCTESGIDFSKSISTYVHEQLGLSRNCRLFELKQACYAGTAGLQMAAGFVLSGASPGAKALVIATDLARYQMAEGGNALSEDWSYAEPSTGVGAVAMLIGDDPRIFALDVGASGYYGHQIMDTCRPIPDSEAGDSDLSLMSYMHCAEKSFAEYVRRVPEADYSTTFDYIAFHTPFGGMVKGTHRSMMRKLKRATPAEIERDFAARVEPGLGYCRRVGNIMGGTVFMSLAGIIAHGDFSRARRIGVFSYGSGCCSEFYSGVAGPQAREALEAARIGAGLDRRYMLSMEEYDGILRGNHEVRFGTRNTQVDPRAFPGVDRAFAGQRRLVLSGIREFQREYAWVQ